MNRVNVPQLRFSGFEGEWEFKRLGDLSDLITKGTTPKKFVQNGIKFIKLECFEGDRINPNKCLFIDENTHNKELKRSILNEGDILFAIAGATIGKVNIVNNEILPANTNQALSIVRLKAKENKDFIYHNLKSDIMRKYILDNISVGAQPNLNLEQMNNFSFFLPSLPEQQKIASFLSAFDEKIQQLSRKKQLLEQYKKGVMQQLFSGKLRFKDKNGKDYPDWEEKKLGEVASKKSSNISANKIEENFGDFIIYGASGVLKKVDFYREENDYISIVKDGAGVGRLLYCKGKSSVLGTMEIISPKQNIDTYFLYCLLSNIDFVKYVTGSTIPHIYFKDYSNEICGIPTFPEQQKMANFLSNIDIKIENTNQEINKMQNFKKGLLQQMFV